MADVFGMETYGASPDAGHSGSAVPGTGDLRRRYNFGDRISELSIAQDPFFRFVSQVAKKPTDDPQFKFTEQRHQYHKRYAYVIGQTKNGSDVSNDATVSKSNASGAVDAVGDSVALFMATDYKSAGNITSIIGQSATKVDVGSPGTRPTFFLPGQVVKIPISATPNGGVTLKGYHLMKVDTVTDGLTLDNKECVKLSGKIVKFDSAGNEFMSFQNNDFTAGGTDGDGDIDEGGEQVYDQNIATGLEPRRSYVVGSAHSQGSGYPESWKDQPYSSAVGLTQIFKTAMAMDNTTRATVLKYEPNEFARIWRTKLIEHKFDIEQALLFGSQSEVDGIQYTEGAINFVTNYGNIFDGSGIGGSGTKSQDDFLDDMSQFLDPRYNNANATLFMCSTDTYNWMHKLSGYFSANVQKVSDGSASLGRSDFQIAGRKGVYGLDITQVFTPYGAMNLVRNVHLDGSPVKILAINMAQCAYRPLVGNGLNRDTAVYVGVQTLENSGVDRRVDLIQTEAGMEWRMPEAHAVWK
tara:strand:+ start:3016 stop:4584 length:1569 start_codon:yes stop_codon:yes gene_type:complete